LQLRGVHGRSDVGSDAIRAASIVLYRSSRTSARLYRLPISVIIERACPQN